MPLTISRKQRDALYELVLDHLTAIGDLWIEFQRRDLGIAKRQAQEFVEDLHLLNDLGWDEAIEGESVTLTMPRGELVRTVARLHRQATGALEAYVSRPKDEEAAAARDVTASGALGDLLSQLAARTRSSSPTRMGDDGRQAVKRRRGAERARLESRLDRCRARRRRWDGTLDGGKSPRPA